MFKFEPFQLTDAEITATLDCSFTSLFDSYENAVVLGPLQEPDLIQAIYNKKYQKIYQKLKNLEQPLSPVDAMAACLCALDGTKLLMNRVLDHCPPIPQFQFRGVGIVSSLLEVAARFDLHHNLDVLLTRGADPNRSSEDSETLSPLESAFQHNSFHCIKRLLAEPTLDCTITERMLESWGELREGFRTENSDLLRFWSCQLLYEHMTGFDCLTFSPIPHQLRLRHALMNNNLNLAFRLFHCRSLDEQDKESVLSFFASKYNTLILDEQSSEDEISYCEKQTSFLLLILDNYPDLLETLEVRQAVAAMALALPQPNEQVQRWVDKLQNGLIPITQLPLIDGGLFSSFYLSNNMAVNKDFFVRWDQRLTHRLAPALSRHSASLSWLLADEMEQIFERITFTGCPIPGQLSNTACAVLDNAPKELLPDLLHGDGLLVPEDAELIFNACMDLPVSRRSWILPYLRKEPDYEL